MQIVNLYWSSDGRIVEMMYGTLSDIFPLALMQVHPGNRAVLDMALTGEASVEHGQHTHSHTYTQRKKNPTMHLAPKD